MDDIVHWLRISADEYGDGRCAEAADTIDALRAALSTARADALEEAARVAEDYEGPGIVGGYNRHLGDGYETRRDIAAAIRALKEGK